MLTVGRFSCTPSWNWHQNHGMSIESDKVSNGVGMFRTGWGERLNGGERCFSLGETLKSSLEGRRTVQTVQPFTFYLRRSPFVNWFHPITTISALFSMVTLNDKPIFTNLPLIIPLEQSTQPGGRLRRECLMPSWVRLRIVDQPGKAFQITGR